MSVLDKIKLGQKVRVTGGLLTAVSSNKGQKKVVICTRKSVKEGNSSHIEDEPFKDNLISKETK